MADWYKASLGPKQAADLTVDNDDQPSGTAASALPFNSRRSPVVCLHGCVASSQPLASQIGVRILQQHGGNAADASIAVAAALAVTEPCSTGLGGDMFCLYYDAAQRVVHAVNGSGKSAAGLTWETLQAAHPATTPQTIDADTFRDSPYSVTVPGAAQGWQDVVKRFGSGKLSLAELLEPAARLAEEGFPVAPITAFHWQSGFGQITKWREQQDDDDVDVPLSVDGRRPPAAGDVMRNPDLARVLRDLGQHGAHKGFYTSCTGHAIVNKVQAIGGGDGAGLLTLDDLASHTSSLFPDPIYVEYRNHRLWQVPPNGQGIAGLIALAGLGQLEKSPHLVDGISLQPGTADAYHAMIEMMRLGFADARQHVSDGDHARMSNETLLNADRVGARAKRLFDPQRAVVAGGPDPGSCTVSFQVVDRDGNAMSFVNSNFMGFGTGIVPDRCGFTLQNRGFGFNIGNRQHPNAVGPSKRPYHTIIPGMLTHAGTNELYATLSNMGGNMQPQGHVQLTVNMLAGNMDPQAAIDMPRFCIADGTYNGAVCLEDGVGDDVIADLERRGHQLQPHVAGHERSIFGRAQIIKRDRRTGVLWAGSDGRADGCAIGY